MLGRLSRSLSLAAWLPVERWSLLLSVRLVLCEGLLVRAVGGDLEVLLFFEGGLLVRLLALRFGDELCEIDSSGPPVGGAAAGVP